MPNLYIIAGPNGVGKTTYARRFFPAEMRCKEFLNADSIAAGLSPFSPATSAFEAGRIMLTRLRELAARREDFSFETTLTGRAYLPILRDLRSLGYRIRLDFLWVRDLETARNRVRSRVAQGGHDIPQDVQERRFHRGVALLLRHYRPFLHQWEILDNSDRIAECVVREIDNKISILRPESLAVIERDTDVRIMTGFSDRVEDLRNVYRDEDLRRVRRASRLAFADAVLDAQRYETPVVLWRPERGTILVPAEYYVTFARRLIANRGEPLSVAEESSLQAAAETYISQHYANRPN